MKKVALIFVVAVLLPSVLLAWLVVRSLRDQQFLLERQQTILCQNITDTVGKNIADSLAAQQQQFAAQVESLAAGKDARKVGGAFDWEIRRVWPLAEVGFCVTLDGKIISPEPNGREESRTFYRDNGAFLGNREPAEVYGNINYANSGGVFNAAPGMLNAADAPPAAESGRLGASKLAYSVQNAQPQQAMNFVSIANNDSLRRSQDVRESDSQQIGSATPMSLGAAPRPQSRGLQSQLQEPFAPVVQASADSSGGGQAAQNSYSQKSQSRSAPNNLRVINPRNSKAAVAEVQADNAEPVVAPQEKKLETGYNFSRVFPAEGEFGAIVGAGTDGMLARFLQNKLRLMFWHRLSSDPNLVFGAQLNLTRLTEGVRELVRVEPALKDEICLALLDDNAKPVALSHPGFMVNWKHPLVATEIGEALPHWEIAAYLIHPEQLTRAAESARLTLILLVGVLLLAIGVGSWLIVRSLGLELKFARQKTDFVSNVSHELKTPLTSIRMFSELLAEGRVADEGKRRSYLNIITAETGRLTRLINNVLDFSRMERGEKKYNFQICNLGAIAGSAADTFRPHLESAGFAFLCELPQEALCVRGDADALSQVVVNLLSNAEKYSNGGREILLLVARRQSPLPHAEIRVLDRGSGVPRGCEEKIFEKFYRAHDSLGSGIQGSGLGLTIARQIARAHGGDVSYEPREGGGSCFVLRLPLQSA